MSIFSSLASVTPTVYLANAIIFEYSTCLAVDTVPLQTQ